MTIDELYERRRKLQVEIDDVERQITAARGECVHLALPEDPNWCEKCWGPMPQAKSA